VVPRMFGARVLLDLHECMPELFATKYGVGPGHPGVRLLTWLEQASIRFADYAITCTEPMREAFVGRGAPPDRIGVVLNAADEELYDAGRYPPASPEPSRFTLICPGAIEERYGLDTLVRAAALVRGEIPGLRVEIYGVGAYRQELERLVRAADLERIVQFHGFVPIDELLHAIATADAGVVAVKRDAFRDLTHCNKMFEYITMRRPAIVSRTRAVNAYFDGSCFELFDSGDERDLARAIRALHAEPARSKRLVLHAAEVNEPYRWPRQRAHYQRLVGELLRRPGRTRRRRAW
jgi:glycosyltransferase involved in cell wall biosynthesis